MIKMDDEMIDRVSYAIRNTPNASDYDRLVAINAIKAMREPTEKMKQLMKASDVDWLPEFWETMINTIANE